MITLEILPNPSKMPCDAPINFFMGEYLSDYSFDLIVDHKDLSDEGVYGWCYKESDDEFLIEIHDDLSEKEYLTTLFHELVHVWQHITNRPLFEGEANLLSWRMLDKYQKSL